MGYLKLGPDGVEVANVVTVTCHDWADVTDIQDHSAAKKTRKAVVLCLSDGSEKLVEGLDFYVPGGAPLYWMVWHYWRHPEDRDELTDGRAVSRLTEGRFELA